jgi:galactokinase
MQQILEAEMADHRGYDKHSADGIVQKNDDNIVRVYSMNFPEKGVFEFSLKELEYTKEHEWANYLKAI